MPTTTSQTTTTATPTPTTTSSPTTAIYTGPPTPENYCNGTGTHDDWHCCTEEHLCKAGHGDCDGDEGCEGDLVCGNDNCYKIYDHLGGEKYAEHEADCCEIKGEFEFS